MVKKKVKTSQEYEKPKDDDLEQIIKMNSLQKKVIEKMIEKLSPSGKNKDSK